MTTASIITLNSRIILTTLVLLFTLGGASAGDHQAPDVLLKHLTDEMMEHMEAEKKIAETSGDPNQIQRTAKGLIQEVLVHHMDMNLMSYLVIGKRWKTIPKEQRQQFIKEFSGMLSHTYAKAIIEFSDKSFNYQPFEPNPKRKDAVVRAEFSGADGSISVLFRVRPNKEGEWKVFDIIVDGVSLIKNYKSSFSAEIRKVGIDGLTARLATHNREQPAVVVEHHHAPH